MEKLPPESATSSSLVTRPWTGVCTVCSVEALSVFYFVIFDAVACTLDLSGTRCACQPSVCLDSPWSATVTSSAHRLMESHDGVVDCAHLIAETHVQAYSFAQIPWQVKWEHLPGSSPYSGALTGRLLPTAPSSVKVRSSSPLRNFNCVATFCIHLHAQEVHSDTRPSIKKKNDSERSAGPWPLLQD